MNKRARLQTTASMRNRTSCFRALLCEEISANSLVSQRATSCTDASMRISTTTATGSPHARPPADPHLKNKYTHARIRAAYAPAFWACATALRSNTKRPEYANTTHEYSNNENTCSTGRSTAPSPHTPARQKQHKYARRMCTSMLT